MLTVCVDFDGVIHSYRQVGLGSYVVADPPVPGAIHWLRTLVDSAKVYIHTTRMLDDGAEGAMREWLSRNGLPEDALSQLVFTARKVPAELYIDDRAFRFEGTFPTVDEIARMKPWNR